MDREVAGDEMACVTRGTDNKNVDHAGGGDGDGWKQGRDCAQHFGLHARSVIASRSYGYGTGASISPRESCIT